MWETMGPLADRSRDRLGSSDLAIIHFRRQMLKAAQAMAAGGPAIGTGPNRTPHASLTSFEGLVRKGTDWRTLGERTAQAAE
jgi:phthalate 4,5-dioxygenase oxygenase subunit